MEIKVENYLIEEFEEGGFLGEQRQQDAGWKRGITKETTTILYSSPSCPLFHSLPCPFLSLPPQPLHCSASIPSPRVAKGVISHQLELLTRRFHLLFFCCCSRFYLNNGYWSLRFLYSSIHCSLFFICNDVPVSIV